MWLSLSHLPASVLPSAAISGLSTEFGRLTPSVVVPPYGHSLNGIGGVVSGVARHPAMRPGGAMGSTGALSMPQSSL